MQNVSTAVERHGVFAAIKSIIHAWWATDRIRIQPTTGRLLSLQPGSQILLHHQLWTITTRDVLCCDSAVRVQYEMCAAENCHVAELVLSIKQTDRVVQPAAVFRSALETQLVWDTDVTVLHDDQSLR